MSEATAQPTAQQPRPQYQIFTFFIPMYVKAIYSSTAAAILKWRNFSAGFNAIKSIAIIAFAVRVPSN